MLKEISLDEVKKFWPQSAPNINNIKKYVVKYKSEKIVIKYGGNVLIDKNIFDKCMDDIFNCINYFSKCISDSCVYIYLNIKKCFK